jgi:hypothetical protein
MNGYIVDNSVEDENTFPINLLICHSSTKKLFSRNKTIASLSLIFFYDEM